MRNPIPYGRQQITEEDLNAVREVLTSDFLTQGPQVEIFEKALCEKIKACYGVAVSNGTAALHLAALALGIKPGDRILVTPITFVASANCIRYAGGEVEFADVDESHHCLDLDLLEERLARNPGQYKGVVVVDFAGFAVDMERLRGIADRHGIWILEDACHALGAEFLDSKGEWVPAGNGCFADAAVFSFHPVKHIATGEGGMVVTGRKDIYEKIRLLRTHGITRDPELMQENHGSWYYEMRELGFNYRMSDILCALGTSQLKRLSQNLERRREIARIYDRELMGISGLKRPIVPDKVKHAFHLYVVEVEKRNELYLWLRENEIFGQVHYIPVHMQPYYRRLTSVQLPVAERYYQHAISLPMYHSLKDEDLGRVVEAMRRFYK